MDVLIAIVALALGALIGWLIAQRRAGGMASDLAGARSRLSEADLARHAHDAVEQERDEFMQEVARLTAQTAERDAAHARAMQALDAQFAVAAAKALEAAQAQFLARADDRFRQSEEATGQNLKSLLQPVEATLKRYEDNLGRIEKEREGSYRELNQAVAQLATNNTAVVRETQRLANVMRSSPKARGRWGEEQLRTILESAGLAENIDFELQATVTDDERALRPDCIVNLPGDRCIVIDVKNVWTAFEAAFDEEDEAQRDRLLRQHADAMRTTAAELGRKGYWRQFDRSPDFVIMFIPGEHILAAAAERAPDLIANAFRNGVVIASTINTLALAKIMSGLWRQETLREQAKEIAEAGKELYKRLATMSAHVAKLGRNLGIAAGAYNDMIGSLESQVYTQAQRFEALGVDTSARKVEPAPAIETPVRSLTKLAAPAEAAE